MKKYILQHAIGDQIPLLDLAKPVNQKYADKFGFDYRPDTTPRITGRSYNWEKIAYLKEFLAKATDGDLIVWEDADSLNTGDLDVDTAMPSGSVFGMVQNRGGLNNSLLIPWYNSGVMLIINSVAIRDFFDQVWDRNGKDDEVAIVEQLKVTTDVVVTPIDPKWNCWLNNKNLVSNPIIQTFHGIPLSKKIDAMKKCLS